MKNDTIQTRNRIAGLFYGEAEHTRDRETRNLFRSMGDRILQDHSGDMSPEKAKSLGDLASLASSLARDGMTESVRDCSERLNAILRTDHPGIQTTIKNKKEGTKMSFIKNIFGKKDAVKDQAAQQMEQSQAFVEAAQKDMDSYSFEYDVEKRRYQELINKLASLDSASAQYKNTIIQVKQAKQKIGVLDEKITSAFRILLSNQDYLARLGMLETIERYAKMVPDASKAQALLSMINESQQRFRDNQDQLDSVLANNDLSKEAREETDALLALDDDIAADIAKAKQKTAAVKETETGETAVGNNPAASREESGERVEPGTPSFL